MRAAFVQFAQKGLAVSQAHCPPAEDTNLIVLSANRYRLSLGVHSVTVVNVVDAIAVPYATVAAHCTNRLDCIFCTLSLNAVVCYLPAAFVGDNLASF